MYGTLILMQSEYKILDIDAVMLLAKILQNIFLFLLMNERKYSKNVIWQYLKL